jgi:hypothetical protein
MCLAAKFSEAQVRRCLGIDHEESRVLSSLRVLNILFQKKLLAPGHGIGYHYADATTFSSYDPVTHIVSFDTGFPFETMVQIGVRFNRYSMFISSNFESYFQIGHQVVATT